MCHYMSIVLSEMNIITEYLEYVFIEVKTRTMKYNKKTIVGIVYRPPGTNIATFTEHVMNIIPFLKKVILSSLMKSYSYTINHFHLLNNYQDKTA